MGPLYASLAVLCFITLMICALHSDKNMLSEKFTMSLHSPILKFVLDTSLISVDMYNPYPDLNMKPFWEKITNIDVISDHDQALSLSTSYLQIQDALDVHKDKLITLSVIPSYQRYATLLRVVSPKTNNIHNVSDIPLLGKGVRIAVFYNPIACDKDKITELICVVCNANNVAFEDLLMISDVKSLDSYEIVFAYASKAELKGFISSFPPTTFSFIDMESSDINMLKLDHEFLRHATIDTDKELDNKQERFPIKKMVCVDVFIVVAKPLPRQFPPSQVYQLMNNIGDEAVALNNYYTQLFEYHDISLQFLRSKNIMFGKRLDTSTPILEQFNNGSVDGDNIVTVHIKQNVNGFLDVDKGIFQVHDVNVKGDFIHAMQVHLESQDTPFENGIYTVIQDEPPIMLQRVDGNMTQDENNITYRCYGDPNTMIPGLCNSITDVSGKAKNIPTFWDAPCQKNIDCPFFQKNNTYPNYRGGCDDNGYCEMPLGVKRRAWRMYDPDSKPICHGCPVSNIHCCDDQHIPDYAFELDHDERRNAVIFNKSMQ